MNVEAKIVHADARVAQIDWERLAGELNATGAAMVERLLTAKECREIATLYDDDAMFRSRIVMARHGFGQGGSRTCAPRSIRTSRRSPMRGTSG